MLQSDGITRQKTNSREERPGQPGDEAHGGHGQEVLRELEGLPVHLLHRQEGGGVRVVSVVCALPGLRHLLCVLSPGSGMLEYSNSYILSFVCLTFVPLVVAGRALPGRR